MADRMQPSALTVLMSVTSVTSVTCRLQKLIFAWGPRGWGIVVGGALGATLANNIVDRSRNARVRCYTSQNVTLCRFRSLIVELFLKVRQ